MSNSQKSTSIDKKELITFWSDLFKLVFICESNPSARTALSTKARLFYILDIYLAQIYQNQWIRYPMSQLLEIMKKEAGVDYIPVKIVV